MLTYKLLSLAAILTLAACNTQMLDAACPSGHMIETKLYFGQKMPNGRKVSNAEWSSFVRTEITPRLPEGFTLMDASGQWQDEQSKRTITEDTKILVRLHAPGERRNDELSKIADTYKKKFQQDSVLRVDQPVCAQF